jgi:CPA1 family monovalent cation:H+ antiporter
MTTIGIVELLVLLLMAASVIALATSRLRIPYTIALVFGGFAIDLFQLPITEVVGPESQILTPSVIFAVFLPGLLFEAGINIHMRHLRANLRPILLLAVAGVVISTAITGYAVHWALELPVLVALLFGALISATDPISVLALFKDMGVDKRLATIVEGESLFNDGTAVVVFQILLAGVVTGTLDFVGGIRDFVVVAIGGAALGLAMGYAASKITEQVDEPRIEITLTTVLAYGSYLVAESLHVSGIIATVMAGLMVGNFGAKFGMSARTRVALWSFWEYFAFVINSLVFLLIGIEVHVADLASSWLAIVAAIAAVLVARALTVYALTPLGNRFAEPITGRWQHVLVWGGLHGGVSMALALSLAANTPFRAEILAMTFGVVTFSIVVQGLTMKPLLARLGLVESREETYDQLRVRRMAAAAAHAELEQMRRENAVTHAVHQQLATDLDQQEQRLRDEVADFQAKHPTLAGDELRAARRRLLTARKSAIQRASADGLISPDAGEHMVEDLDQDRERLEES